VLRSIALENVLVLFATKSSASVRMGVSDIIRYPLTLLPTALIVKIKRSMKKSTIWALIGLAASANPAFSTGAIFLDNYDTSGPDITYYLGPPMGGQGLQPAGWGGVWTVGLFYAMGDVTGSVAADPSGWSDPRQLYSGFMLGTGPGSTATIYYSAFDTPGEFYANSPFQIAGNPGDTITVMLVAYDLSSYDAGAPPPHDLQSLWGRGHSAPFTMTLSDINSAYANSVGYFMPGFIVWPAIPEPALPALGALGAAVLMLTSRKCSGRGFI
jgi:hypothetical protein